MVVKMYKGSSECIADKDQIPVMTNAGWSREKPVPKKEVAPVEKTKAVKAPGAKADVKVVSTEVASKKKEIPKKRRSVTKK